MAYSKIVIWPSPYLDNQKLPPGSYGMRYTYVDVDVPLFDEEDSVEVEHLLNPSGRTLPRFNE